MKVAVVTPYCDEEDSILLRCIKSVQAQTVPCQHYLIADGAGHYWINSRVKRHIILGKSHNDYGNTPRAIGALLAISEGADAVAFLDADNTYDPDHIETCLAAVQANPGIDYVAAKRRIVLPDDTPVSDKEASTHVDTNCFFLLPGAYFAIPQLALQPKPMAIDGDRFFLFRLNALKSVATDKPTVTYRSNWAPHYRQAGREVPPTAKHTETPKLKAWWNKQTPAQRETIFRHIGVRFELKP